jgi:hypothetical protein
MQSTETPRLTAKSSIHRNKRVLKLYFPYRDDLIEKIRSLPGVAWSNSMKCWYIQDTVKSLSALHNLEGITVLIESKAINHTEGIDEEDNRSRMLVTRYHKGRMRVVFNFDAKLIALIKTLPFFYYDAEAQWWTLPHLESVLEILKGYCKDNNIKLEYFDEWTDRKVIARKREGVYEHVICPPEFENKLKIRRYSENTIRNYCSALKEFMAYNGSKLLESINQTDIEKFLLFNTNIQGVKSCCLR